MTLPSRRRWAVAAALLVTWVRGSHDLPLERPIVIAHALTDLTASARSQP